MRGDAPKSHLTGVPGWETFSEQEYLKTLAEAVPANGRILEIGAEYGMSSSIFCRFAHPSVEVVSIDIFGGNMLEIHRQNLAEAGLADRSRQLVGDSAIVGKTWKDPIDLLFIDGDHSYGGCASDIRIFTPFVMVGGMVAFHDMAQMTNLMPHAMHYMVTKAVNEWQYNEGRKWSVRQAIDTLLVFERIAS